MLSDITVGLNFTRSLSVIHWLVCRQNLFAGVIVRPTLMRIKVWRHACLVVNSMGDYILRLQVLESGLY